MYLYVPDNVAAHPALLVAVHYCTGSGPALYSGTEFASLADQYGFIVIYPSVTRSSKCFDVSSPQALSRDGGSDPVGIMSMVDYVRQPLPRRPEPDRRHRRLLRRDDDQRPARRLPGRVQRRRGVSRACPFGCFATTNGSEWNSDCAGGQITKTPQQWGDLVRNAYPGYTGPRPRMQLWHGTDGRPPCATPTSGRRSSSGPTCSGVSQTPSVTDTPQSGCTRTRYGGTGATAPVEAISIQGVGTPIPCDAAQAIRFFGLDSTSPTTPPPTPTTTPPPTTPPPNPTTTPPEPDHAAADDSAGYGRVFGVGVVEFVDGWFRGHGEGDRGFLGYPWVDGEHDPAGWDECDRYVVGVGQW